MRHPDGKLLHVMGNVKLVEEHGELFYQRFLLDITVQKLRETKERTEPLSIISSWESYPRMLRAARLMLRMREPSSEWHITPQSMVAAGDEGADGAGAAADGADPRAEPGLQPGLLFRSG